MIKSHTRRFKAIWVKEGTDERDKSRIQPVRPDRNNSNRLDIRHSFMPEQSILF